MTLYFLFVLPVPCLLACCASQPLEHSLASYASLRDEGWNWPLAVLNFSIHFHRTEKEFKLNTVFLGISEQIKPLQLVCQAAEFCFESVQATAGHLEIKPEGYSRGHSKV